MRLPFRGVLGGALAVVAHHAPPASALRHVLIVANADEDARADANAASDDDGDDVAAAAPEFDDDALPDEVFPRLALLSVAEPARCYTLLRHGVLPTLERCLPGIDAEVIAALGAELDAAMRLERYATVTLVFWWLFANWEPVRHMVTLSERQHAVADARTDALSHALCMLMETVATAAFEPHNAYTGVVVSFYALALSMVALENDALVTAWAAVRPCEKVPRANKTPAPPPAPATPKKPPAGTRRGGGKRAPAAAAAPSADDAQPLATLAARSRRRLAENAAVADMTVNYQ